MRVEQGRGTTVQPRDAWNLLDPVVIRIALVYDDDTSLLDGLLTVRRLLEGEMALAAATRLTDAELATLADTLEGMETSYDDYERFRAFDLAFHAIVMKASGNEVGLTIVRTIHSHGGVTPILSSGSLARPPRADGRRSPRDLRGTRSARWRAGRRPHLRAHRERVGGAEADSAASLTA